MFFGKSRGFLAILLTILAAAPNASPQSVGLLREVWQGIDGTDLSALTSSPNYPDRPTSRNFVTDLFESPTDILENYGQRMHGYVVPPITGNYTFWVSTDDQGALYLSSDENPSNSRLIARVDGWTPPRQWEVESNQRSAAIPLVAGKAYYISALMKEGGGGDNLAVRWLMPNGVDQAPIVATNLLPFGISFTAPVIARHPADTTAVENGFARFTVALSSVGPATFSWRRNGAPLADSNTPEFLFGPVNLADHGARFSVVITNSIGSVTSSAAVLAVTPDVTPPSVVDIINVGTRNLRVTFSESIAAPSASSIANFTISPGVSVVTARPGASPEIIELEVSELTLEASYTLTIQGVLDRARTPNAIAPGTRIPFTAREYTPGRVGSPSGTGAVEAAPGGADVTSGGEIGGRSDAFEFGYQRVTGNFDRRVRVAAFTPTDPFAVAGLMAWATLDANSPFAAAVATPGVVGSHLLSRSTASANAQRAGSFSVNYPQTWLRLARSGSTFRAFAGFDGESWTELGSVSLNLPSTVFFGFAVGSWDTLQTARAEFRDAGDVTSVSPSPNPSNTVGARAETPGPSSRLSPLAFSEIMYHPLERADGRNTEFVEIHNADLIDQDLTGHRISGDINYEFPKGFVLPAGGYAVIARNPVDFASAYELAGILGPFEGTNNLPNSSGTIRLRNPQNAVLLEVTYDSRAPWPVAADGAGHSLVLARPSYGEGDPRAWSASARIGGSPGGQEVVRTNPRASVLLNEVLAHTDLPQLDLVELYNHGNDALDLGGCILTDDPTIHRFRIPEGTRIAPRGFLEFNEDQLGFRLDAAGESVFLIDADATRVLDAVRFGPQENGVSSGRYPDGTPEWRRLASITAGSANPPFLVSPVVLNEILYNPISGDSDDEFVELFNRTSAPISLDGWSFTDGIDYRFPTQTVIGPNAYLVVAKNRSRLLANHPGLSPGAVVGDYGGTLSNGGERIALAKPDFITTTNELGVIQRRRIDIEVAEVTYGTGGRWGQWSDGLGSSLELIDPFSDALQPSNWADSDESAKAPWTTIEFTGRVDNVASGVSSSRLHLLAQGPGEYLIDDIQVVTEGGANRVANANFDSGLTGWTVQGNHRRSALAAGEGSAGSNALRIRATGRGDTAVNRVRAPINPALAANSTATLRARVRWIRGWPEFLLRTLGNGIEAFGRLTIPGNLGTPGARNSRAVNNAGPALFDVTHSPAVPAGGQAVVVTARVTDPDGVDTVSLRYRQDPSTSQTTVTMRDDGSSGDEVAGDGIFSGRIPGRAAGVLVAFTVSATDRESNPASSVFPQPATFPFPTPTPREALVRWGESKPFGNLGVYRFWQRQADANSLRSRESLANDPLDCTFVHGDERVIYNAEMRAKGSPWHGGSVGSDYVFTMPDDDPLLGARDLAIVTLGNLGNDGTAQREQAAFWIGRQLGAASLHRRHIHFFENGNFKGLYEDTEEPNGLYVDRWFPDGQDGDLFKIEDWFEFNDSGGNFVFSRDATLERFTTVGSALKQARYRWAWRKRAIQGSANDYSSLLQLVEIVANPSASTAPRIEALIDVENWMRTFALQHIVGNWDAYGYGRGKNSYAYLPTGGRWKIIPWDIDFVLGLSSDGPTTDVFGSVDPTVSRLWDVPVIRRAYWRAFQDAVNGPLVPGNIEPVLDARHAALVANGFNVENPGPIKDFVRQRRAYLANRAASEDTPALAITSNNGSDFTTANPSVTLTGRAPIALQTLLVNGVAHPVRWTSVTGWSLDVALGAPVNRFDITGLNSRGEPVPGAADSVTVRYSGPPIDPTGLVVINEILFDPPASGAAFVEILNTSSTGAFDLSGWNLNGAGFTFPAGSVLLPGAFAVVAADLATFRATYGSSVVPIGQFDGNLQNDGERLSLVQPGVPPEPDKVINAVRYETQPPWPSASGNGASLQLIDPRLDNRRPANWAAAPTNSPPLSTPGRPNSVAALLEPFPNVWINEIQPRNASGPADQAGDRDPWIELHNAGDTEVDLARLTLSLNPSQLNGWGFPSGTTLAPGQFLV
ncbi:MAG: lamin tail domain-containing protein, partial [Limisphaerales bacterium]